jgi:hypothetical protein
MSFDKLVGIPVTSTLTKEKFAEVIDKPKLKQKMVDAFAAANGEVEKFEITDNKIKAVCKDKPDPIEIDIDDIFDD